MVLVPCVMTTPAMSGSFSRASTIDAESLELLGRVAVQELVRIHAHARELLDFRDALDQLLACQARLAGGRVAKVFKPVLRVARQRSGTGEDMDAHLRSLLWLRRRKCWNRYDDSECQCKEGLHAFLH